MIESDSEHQVRFDGWQDTAQMYWEVHLALRKTLFVRYKMRDQDLFERAHEYIREYY
jgi:type I restriction enzyme R subunit